MGGVILLLMFSPFAAQKIDAQTLPDHIIANLVINDNIHDVIINCDMLETRKTDGRKGTIKAIAWDNGERFLVTGGTSQSWLYVEDAMGHSKTISLGQHSSNSGYNILSAYADGHKVRYKESPNAFLFKTTNVSDLGDDKSVKVYPNPAQDKLFIEADGEYSYSINDITGKTLLNGKYKGDAVDVSCLPTGFYLLKLLQPDKAPTIYKFSKQ